MQKSASFSPQTRSHPSLSPQTRSHPSPAQPTRAGARRRQLFIALPLAFLPPPPANASKLGPAIDSLWEAATGAPPDLYYPPIFLGTWVVSSTLVSASTPFGPTVLPDGGRAFERARTQDLDKTMQYLVRFIESPYSNPSSSSQPPLVISDRKFNTASLLGQYYNDASSSIADRIAWDANDPNLLSVSLPSGVKWVSNVRKRSESLLANEQRLETSEFLQQETIDARNNRPIVKGSQCFTKYKWREVQGDGGVQIIATQVVSDYLVPDDAQYLTTMNKPVVLYTYRMGFARLRDDNL